MQGVLLKSLLGVILHVIAMILQEKLWIMVLL